MEFSVLGPVEVRADGRSLRLQARQLVGRFERLAVSPNAFGRRMAAVRRDLT